MTEKVDTLLVNAIVLTMDSNYSLYEPGAVAILGEKIVAVGEEKGLRGQFESKETIDCQGQVIMPGLVNAHTHVPMTLMRGLADDLRLDVWLLGYMMPVEREYVSPDFVRLGTLLACIELIQSGVTCFADMYYFEEHVARATAEVGLRAVCSQTVLKFPAPDAGSFEESLAEAREFISRWKGHSLIEPSVAPHSPYTCTGEILQACASLAAEFDVPLHTHLAETATEVETSRQEQNMPVIPYVRKQGLFDAKVLAAHCVHIDDGEIQTLLRVNAGVAHNPSSNLKLASGFAPVKRMLDLGLNVGIGTDGPASNNDLDMFEEMRLASFLAKSVSNDPTALPAQVTLAMATRLGANALHLGKITGSIEPGKRADLIRIDLRALHSSPRFHRDPANIYAQIVYSSKASDVTDVMVNGNWLMRNRLLSTLDPIGLLKHAEEFAKKIDIFLIEREKSILSKLIAIGGAMEVESFEVQTKVHIANPEMVIQALQTPEIEILHRRHYHEYDTYFIFADLNQGTLRYREDEFVEQQEHSPAVRYRLTMIGPMRERQFANDVILSRSRFMAPATHSLRFYREYFKPTKEVFIEKDRLRWRVLFQGTEFYINLDQLLVPEKGYFLEIKSRTWSRRDADRKSEVIEELIKQLSAADQGKEPRDYLEIIQS